MEGVEEQDSEFEELASRRAALWDRQRPLNCHTVVRYRMANYLTILRGKQGVAALRGMRLKDEARRVATSTEPR